MFSSPKYTKLPTDDKDSVTIDFSSAFNYGTETTIKPVTDAKFMVDYSSPFTYTKNKTDDRDTEHVEPTLFSRVCTVFVTVVCYIGLFISLPISGWFAFKSIQQFERVVIYRLGRLLGSKGPGIVFIMPCIDKWKKVDLRMKAFSVPPQRIMTGDGATIEIGADVYFRVNDPVKSVSNVQDLNHSCRIISQTVTQTHLGKMRLTDIEMDRQGVAVDLQKEINRMTLEWGVEVGKIELSQIKILEEQNPLMEAAHYSSLGALGPLLFPGGGPGGEEPPQIISGLPQFQDLFSQIGASMAQAQQAGNAGQMGPMGQMMQAAGGAAAGLPMPSASGAHATPSSFSAQNKIKYQSPKVVNPVDLIKTVKPMLNSSLVNQFQCIYKFNITGPGGGEFYLDLKNGSGSANEGDPPFGSPDVTLTLSIDDMQEVFTMQLSPLNAYMSGRLLVDGDLRAATRLKDLLPYMMNGFSMQTLGNMAHP